MYEVFGASVGFTGEEPLILSSESWEVVGFCEVVLNLVLVSVGLTGVPDFLVTGVPDVLFTSVSDVLLVTLVRLVEDIQVVLLLGAEVKLLPSDFLSE